MSDDNFKSNHEGVSDIEEAAQRPPGWIKRSGKLVVVSARLILQCVQTTKDYASIINRPGVAGAVLHTPL